jgi:hypothetical protein
VAFQVPINWPSKKMQANSLPELVRMADKLKSIT